MQANLALLRDAIRTEGYQAYNDRMGKWENPHRDSELESEWELGWKAAHDGLNLCDVDYWFS